MQVSRMDCVWPWGLGFLLLSFHSGSRWVGVGLWRVLLAGVQPDLTWQPVLTWQPILTWQPGHKPQTPCRAH